MQAEKGNQVTFLWHIFKVPKINIHLEPKEQAQS